MAYHLNRVVEHVRRRLTAALPGRIAHEPLRAVPVEGRDMNFKHITPPKPGSVLVLLYEDNQVVKFPLIKRPVYAGAHSGQISLPGGKAEAGEDYVKTALREAEEEIGVKQTEIEVLGCLSEFYVIPSNFLVTPVVGVVAGDVTFTPDAFEVERILSGTLTDLLKQDAVKQKEILAAGKYRMMAPHFEIDNEIVWGATAMMLNEFRLVLQEALG